MADVARHLHDEGGGGGLIVLPDILHVINITIGWGQFDFHGVGLHWVKEPSAFMPTNSDHVSSTEETHRTSFWIAALFLTYVITVILGTAIMSIKCNRPEYSSLPRSSLMTPQTMSCCSCVCDLFVDCCSINLSTEVRTKSMMRRRRRQIHSP